MKLPSWNEYPKEVHIGEETYQIIFPLKMPRGIVGECCSADKYIRIRRTQSKAQLFRSFVHEVLHAIEAEYEIPVSHKAVYGLERAIVDTLLFNL